MYCSNAVIHRVDFTLRTNSETLAFSKMILGFFLRAAIASLFSFTLVSAWQFPSPNFVKEFAKRYELKSTCFYFPIRIEEDHQWLVKWHKEYFSTQRMVYKSPSMVEKSHYYNKSFDDMDLHVFIPDHGCCHFKN